MNPDEVSLKSKQLALELAESVQKIGPLNPDKLPAVLPRNIQSVINQYAQGHGTPHIAQEVINAFSSVDKANVTYNFLKAQNSIPLSAFISALNSFSFSEYPKHLEQSLFRSVRPLDPSSLQNKLQPVLTPKEAVQQAKATAQTPSPKPESKPQEEKPEAKKPPKPKTPEKKAPEPQEKTEKPPEPGEVKVETQSPQQSQQTTPLPSQPTTISSIPRPPLLQSSPLNRTSYNPIKSTAVRLQRAAVRTAPVISRAVSPLATNIGIGTQRLTRIGLPSFIGGFLKSTGGGLGGILGGVIGISGNGGGGSNGGNGGNRGNNGGGFFSGGNPFNRGRRFLGRGSRNLAAQARKRSIIFWIILAIIILVILGGIFGLFGGSERDRQPLVVDKTGPAQVANDAQIPYTINIRYNDSSRSANIQVIDRIPPQTEYIVSTPSATRENNILTWTFNNVTGTNPIPPINLILKPIPGAKDFWVKNTAEAKIIGGSSSSTTNTAPAPPLQISKTASSESINSGGNIEYSIKLQATSLAGEKVTVTDNLPNLTSFVSADNDGSVSADGKTVTWNLAALKSSKENRIIPPQKGPAQAGVGRPVQRVTASVEQLRQELERENPAMSKYAQAVFDAGTKVRESDGTVRDAKPEEIVDPAFIMAIWRMENYYFRRGGYDNNPGSIVFVRDGYLGMKKGVFNVGRYWGYWDRMEDGLQAIGDLIRRNYYTSGQTDTWTIHSGKDETDTNQYHGRTDIGIGDITSWEKYVQFHYNWVDVMDKITGGGSFSIDTTLKLVLRADGDKIWAQNKASAFAPGIGPVDSSNVVVKIGDAPEAEKPVTTGAVGSGGFSCPLKGQRTISCGSFMSDPKFNQNACAGPTPEDRGHIGKRYGGYLGSAEATKNSRRAHSIDVNASPGEVVHLPTIEGKEVQWVYESAMSYAVDQPGVDNGGGYGHVFSTKIGADRWVLHLLHMDTKLIPPQTLGGDYKSGDPVTTVAATSFPHLHINIGKNPSQANGGTGWLNPEDLGMCVH